MTDVYYRYGATGAGWNRAGRVYRTESGTVTDEKKYGRLGETTELVRTIVFNNAATTYTTKYEWDNLGRMRIMQYPDKETVMYVYDKGGLLKSVSGTNNGSASKYIKSMQYDKYGSRTRVEYGNGAISTLVYEPVMHRLTGLTTTDSAGILLQNIAYEYDHVGNIETRNNTDFFTSGTDTKNAEQTYKYDDLHRLVESTGTLKSADSKINEYENKFTYDNIHRITQKIQTATDASKTYNWSYAYSESLCPHAVTDINSGEKKYTYDHNGNMTKAEDSLSSITRALTWDDENRLTKVEDTYKGTDTETTTADKLTTFAYDADGQRVVKSGAYGDILYVSSGYTIRNSDTISKHVFAGNTRVLTKLVTLNTENGITSAVDKGAYYYHGDHLGSSSVITDNTGKYYEHIEYFPYGEDWVDEKASSTSESVAYKFTAKEYDAETGLYYHGDRYRDAILGPWPSPDPALPEYLPSANDHDIEHDYYWYLSQDASSKLPGIGGVFNSVNLNPYHYAGNNPVKFIDPDGREDIIFTKSKNPTSGKFESVAMVYKDDTFKSKNFAYLQRHAQFVQKTFGRSIDKKDVELFLGKANETFNDFSTLPDDTTRYGTVASGELLSYKEQGMSWTNQSFLLSSKLGEGIVPQDKGFNKGNNPAHPNNNFLSGVFMHAAKIGSPTAADYQKGSHGCPTRQGFSSFYDYLKSSATGSSGHVMIYR